MMHKSEIMSATSPLFCYGIWENDTMQRTFAHANLISDIANSKQQYC